MVIQLLQVYGYQSSSSHTDHNILSLIREMEKLSNNPETSLHCFTHISKTESFPRLEITFFASEH